MSGYKATGRTCAKSKREKNSKFKLPFEARNIDKIQYFNDTFINALKFHFFSHDLTVPYPVARKVLYDIWYDALKNSNDKIHKKNIELEYTNYLEYFNEKLPRYHEYVRDWEAYRKSELYQETIRTLQEIHRTDHRLRIATDFALAYLYAKYQTRHNYETVITKVEQALHLDIIPRVWSKTPFWLAMQLLVFDPSNLYANTIGNNKVYVSEFDKIKEEAIKIYITPWYEREDVKLSQEWRNVALVYHDLIVPLAGEVGSVALAEAARRGTVISLIHLANALSTLASLHPAMRTVSTASKILEFAATFLNKSILAWLGWQVGVEWALDGAIQKVLTEFAKYLYTKITGEPIKKGYYLDNELKEVSEAVKLYLSLLNGKGYIDGSDVKLAEWYNNASLKLRFLFDKIVKTLEVKEQIFNLLKQAKLKKIEAENILDNSFNYVCASDANSFVKFIDDTISTAFDKIDKYIDSVMLTKNNSEYKSFVLSAYNNAKNFLLDKSYLSLYEKHKNYEIFGDTYHSITYSLKRPFTKIEENKAFVATEVFASVRNYFPAPGANTLDIDFTIQYTNSNNEPFGYEPVDCFDIRFHVIIEDSRLFGTRKITDIDFYKLITDCNNINDVISALDLIDPNIKIDISSDDFETINKFKATNKLKVRKQKRCISVINKYYRRRQKQKNSELFNFSYSNFISRRVYFDMSFSILTNEFSQGVGYTFETVLKNDLSVSKNKANYTIQLQQQATKIIADELIYDIGASLKEIYDVMQIPILLSYTSKTLKSINYSKNFNIEFVRDKTEIEKRKSKRSKIVCLRQF
jgi:hypothetical protein